MTETISTEPSTEPSTEVVLLGEAMERLQGDKSVTMVDLLKILRPDPVNASIPAERIPPPATISADQRKALERLVEVFGQIVPTERRTLWSAEVSSLLEEKAALAAITKMSKDRTEGIRTTVYNHLDVEAEGEPFDLSDTPRDKDGHYILKGEVSGTGDQGKRFTREIREGAPSLDLVELKALADSEDFPEFTHQTYLSMTTQTRVVDEAKIMLALKKNPSLVKVIAAASVPGSVTSSFNVR